MNFGDILSILEEDTGNVPAHARTRTHTSWWSYLPLSRKES